MPNHALIFFSLGIAICKPYVTGPTPIICPGNNETLVFTCRDSQVLYLTWSLRLNYTRDSGKDTRLIYTPARTIGTEYMTGPFTANLVDVYNVSNSTTPTMADMVSTLTVSTKRQLNETNLTFSCITRQRIDQSELSMSIPLLFAGICSYI